jgi:hypothetical protein
LWDFSKIPVFPPDCEDRFENTPAFSAPGLSGPIQAKLKIGAVYDPLEREAERAADQVMRMPGPEVSLAAAPLQISRKCVGCEKEEKLQRRPARPQTSVGEVAAVVHEVLGSPGEPLDPAARAFFEPRFGMDFGGVRVHTGTRAGQSAGAVNALAYTVGSHIVLGDSQCSLGAAEVNRLLAHELTHVVQQSGGGSQRVPDNPLLMPRVQAPFIQRQPKKPGKESEPAAKEEAKGPHIRVFTVRDKKLAGGGTLVDDLVDLKRKLMATNITGDWTLVVSMHGSEERLGAQSGPNWSEKAIFYGPSEIDKLFGDDKDYVKWRDKFGPTGLSMVSCQISKSFEGKLITNLTRGGKQSARGLGEGCKPIATFVSIPEAPAKRSDFDKLSPSRRDSIINELKKLNEKWGYYGIRPVPEDQILDYYYDEEPKGEWVEVEVRVGKEHEVEKLTKTGIPFWNRTTGPDSAKFRELCDQGVTPFKREHVPTAPEVP